MESFVDKCFSVLGRVFFPRRQAWEQRRNAKIMFGVIAFSLTLGLVLMFIIRMIYNKRNS